MTDHSITPLRAIDIPATENHNATNQWFNSHSLMCQYLCALNMCVFADNDGTIRDQEDTVVGHWHHIEFLNRYPMDERTYSDDELVAEPEDVQPITDKRRSEIRTALDNAAEFADKTNPTSDRIDQFLRDMGYPPLHSPMHSSDDPQTGPCLDEELAAAFDPEDELIGAEDNEPDLDDTMPKSWFDNIVAKDDHLSPNKPCVGSHNADSIEPASISSREYGHQVDALDDKAIQEIKRLRRLEDTFYDICAANSAATYDALDDSAAEFAAANREHNIKIERIMANYEANLPPIPE